MSWSSMWFSNRLFPRYKTIAGRLLKCAECRNLRAFTLTQFQKVANDHSGTSTIILPLHEIPGTIRCNYAKTKRCVYSAPHKAPPVVSTGMRKYNVMRNCSKDFLAFIAISLSFSRGNPNCSLIIGRQAIPKWYPAYIKFRASLSDRCPEINFLRTFYFIE